MRELDYTPDEPTRAQLEQQVEELEVARETDAETIAELRAELAECEASRERLQMALTTAGLIPAIQETA